ncbi:competence protein CoiA family protein [Roseovarius sp.]|uniref:competence protein CoiA family protein n=1 Tax=Roseovarius sp. TaxID=1486281 RepID=UPI003446F1EC
MRFALVKGERSEPRPTLTGKCPACDNDVLARCGRVRVWHWAHLSVRACRSCDSWWERETEWHRTWKDQFPKEWQEVVMRAEDGERHIADVRSKR